MSGKDYEAGVYEGVYALIEGIYEQAEKDLNFDPSDEEMVEMVRTIRLEARTWLDDNSEKWGSFNHLCGVLGRSPRDERARLRKALTERGEKA